MGNGLVISGWSPTVQVGEGFFDVDLASKASYGVSVVRATQALPAATVQTPIFTVAGGSVMLVNIFGVVMTVVQTQANNTKLVWNPTVGADVDMCAVLDITAKAVGTVLTITGVLANAMLSAVLGLTQTQPQILQPGTIDLLCAATNTGAVKWIATYRALEPGATLVAA